MRIEIVLCFYFDEADILTSEAMRNRKI